jgi:phage terminase large subunit-like protein
MRFDLTRDQIKRFHGLPAEDQREVIEGMTATDALLVDAWFEMWAEDNQLLPDGEGWRVWLMLAGRGFGKTRAGAEWVHALGSTRGKRIALVAASIDEARSIMVEGASGLLTVARGRKVSLRWEPSLKRLTWPSGSVAELYSGDSAEGLRGPEHHFAWCDELAKWRQAEAAWTNLPPSNPVDGQCFVVGTAPTGAWAGQAKAIAGLIAP